MILSDGTVAQLTDMSFHLRYLTGMLSWDNVRLLRYAAQLETPFSLKIADGKPALFHNGVFVDNVSFPEYTDFYKRKTASGMPYIGNAVIQGLDWVAFQCLWPCEYAAAGTPCEFCFSGADHQNAAQKGRKLPEPVGADDVAEIVGYAVERAGCRGVQITGGSTFDGSAEARLIKGYLAAIREKVDNGKLNGEILLYASPPADYGVLDEYFGLGADRVACSVEIWDEAAAKSVTPGKAALRGRYIGALEYAASKYGAGKAFSNFIIGIEDFETLRAGASFLAERGVMPTASVWMPMGRPVRGSMRAPGVDYYRRVKELFAELYVKHGLEPPAGSGLNVCIECDIWNYAQG